MKARTDLRRGVRVKKGHQRVEGQLKPRGGLHELRKGLRRRRAGQGEGPGQEMAHGRPHGVARCHKARRGGIIIINVGHRGQGSKKGLHPGSEVLSGRPAGGGLARGGASLVARGSVKRSSSSSGIVPSLVDQFNIIWFLTVLRHRPAFHFSRSWSAGLYIPR